MFLAPNTVTYKSPVLDPWFKATTASNLTGFDGRDFTEYKADYWVGVLACADQFQLRNPANGKSTSLASYSYIPEEIDKLQCNKVQEATVVRLFYAINTQTTYYSVHSQGAQSLRATETLDGSDFIQIGLPDNQWMIEATEMFSVSLAKLQQQILQYAIGPAYFHEGLPFMKGDKNMCGRQKIRGVSGVLSFSVLGVSIILILGGLLILTALVLDTIVGFIRRKLDRGDHKRLQWAVDETLQLQRLAFEGAGQGRWSGGTNAVPTTSGNEQLGFGVNSNKDHPRLSRNGYYSVPLADGTNGSDTPTTNDTGEKTMATISTSREISQS